MITWAEWARKARGAGVVLAVREDWAARLPELCPQARLLGAATMRGGKLAVRVAGCDELLLLVPPPPKKGSQAADNYLPW